MRIWRFRTTRACLTWPESDYETTAIVIYLLWKPPVSEHPSVLLTVIGGVVGAALGATATIATGALGYIQKDRELDIRLVDVGLAILSGENKGATTEPARRFALRLLSKYANVEIPRTEFDEWAKNGILPLSDLINLLSQRQNMISDIDKLAHGIAVEQDEYSDEISSKSSGIAGFGPIAQQKLYKIHKLRSDIVSLQAGIAKLQQEIDQLSAATKNKNE